MVLSTGPTATSPFYPLVEKYCGIPRYSGIAGKTSSPLGPLGQVKAMWAYRLEISG
jgi:hypothetical protein